MRETIFLEAPVATRARIVPLASHEDAQRLVGAAASDEHIVVAPTHLVMKGEEIVGYGSLGAIRLVNVWVHSRKVNKFESVRLLREAEEILRGHGAGVVCMPCDQKSPFRPFMPRLGYAPLGHALYCLKNLNPT